MEKLKKNHKVKTGIEVCNFQNQSEVKRILDAYNFDYIIGSVHFLKGWAYDSSEIKNEWNNHDLHEIYEWYTQEVEKIAESNLYDVLGHPFNIRLFKNIPNFILFFCVFFPFVTKMRTQKYAKVRKCPSDSEILLTSR